MNTMKIPDGVIHWLPRIICILSILFISMFAADAFTPGLTLLHQLGALFMHLIPSFILLAFLIVAWKWEFIGGMIFMLIGLGTSPFVFILNYRRTHSIWISLEIIALITIPFVLVGILFIVSNYKTKKNHTAVWSVAWISQLLLTRNPYLLYNTLTFSYPLKYFQVC